MNLGQTIRAGVKWLVVGNTGGQVLQFLFGIAMARLLVPADFGMVATIHVFTGFVGVVASGGMGQSLIRAKEADEDDFNAVLTMQLGLGVLIYVGFFVAAPWIARYLENPLYADLLRVSALTFLMRPFSFVRISWLSREMEFKRRTQITLSVGLVTGVSSVSMALAGWGVWSLMLSGLLAAFVSNVLYALATPLRPRLNFSGEAVRRHAAYGFKVTASEVLKHLKEQSINLVMSKMAGPTFLGLFNKAESLARLPNKLVTPATGTVVFRALSKVQDDLDQTKYMFHRTITLLMVYIFPSLVGLWWVADPLIGLVYGERWVPIVEPLRIIILGGIFRTIMIPCSLVLAAQNRMGQEAISEAVNLVFAVTAFVIGLRWGLPGVAWALVLSNAFNAAYVYALAARTIPVRLSGLLRAAAPAALLNALLFAVLAFTHFLLVDVMRGMPVLYVAVMVAVGVAVYGTAFLFLPIPALRTESRRWKDRIRQMLKLPAGPSK